jgi:hypothetical protein
MQSGGILVVSKSLESYPPGSSGSQSLVSAARPGSASTACCCSRLQAYYEYRGPTCHLAGSSNRQVAHI